jgi:hypothetical protein
MKTKTDLKLLKILIVLVSIIIFISCSNSDDGNGNGDGSSEGTSYISYDVIGSAVNGAAFKIPPDNLNDPSNVMILGAINPGGLDGILSLTFATGFGINDTYMDFTINAPATVGSHPVGEILTTNTGIISDLPQYHTIVSFSDAFYDSDNDNDNDLLTNLLSKTISVQITEIETTQVNGITVLKYVKGSVVGGAVYKAYTGPTTDPQELFHTVDADFEYHLPQD